MKILIASDSFKGSLSSAQICDIFEKAAAKVFPAGEIIALPVADGGEGTAEAVITLTQGYYETVRIHNPLMEEHTAVYGVFHTDCALIEMAAASGLTLVPPAKRNPLYTTSYGTGELIKAALDKGCRKIFITLGGSATNDGGMGALRALGVRFFDSRGTELLGCGADLEKVHHIDLRRMHPAVLHTQITVLCDVNNPLTGKTGAAYIFGKQKGGTPDILDRLENGMCRYAACVKKTCTGVSDVFEGAGAAGGLGFALCVFLRAKIVSGIDTVLDLIDFNRYLEGVDLVVTGEGSTDLQSAFGKLPNGIASRCKIHGIPVVMLSGSMGYGAEKIYGAGIASILTTVNAPMTIAHAMENAEPLYFDAAFRLLRMIQTGMQIKSKSLKTRNTAKYHDWET